MKINWCLYCSARARDGVCWAHADLPALDYQFDSLRKRLLTKRSEPTSEQGKRVDLNRPGAIECS